MMSTLKPQLPPEVDGDGAAVVDVSVAGVEAVVDGVPVPEAAVVDGVSVVDVVAVVDAADVVGDAVVTGAVVVPQPDTQMHSSSVQGHH